MNAQRKGQWLINQIRLSKDHIIVTGAGRPEEYLKENAWSMEVDLWNMTNDEFDKYMKGYND